MVEGMGELNAKKRHQLPDSAFAFPAERKMPLNDAGHVRNAAARLNQVEDVSAAEKKTARARIERAAKKKGVDLSKTAG